MLMLDTVGRDPALFVAHLAVLAAVTLVGSLAAARTIEALVRAFAAVEQARGRRALSPRGVTPRIGEIRSAED